MQRTNISRLWAGSLEVVKKIYVSRTHAVPKYFRRGRIARSGKTYMSAACMPVPEYLKAVGWTLEAAKHICRPARM